jgi:hypothetical protein
VHPAVPALCYLLAQIRQPNIGSVTLNQFLFSVLTGASAFRARQTDNFAGIFCKRKRASHWSASLVPLSSRISRRAIRIVVAFLFAFLFLSSKEFFARGGTTATRYQFANPVSASKTDNQT